MTCIQTTTSGKRIGGFTLVELMVAVAILVIVVAMSGTIFTSAGEAVSRSTGLTDIQTKVQAFRRQFTADIEQMLGPAQGGYLAIRCQRYTNCYESETPGGGSIQDIPGDVRADQIAFFATGDFRSMVDPNIQANTAWLRYGHAGSVMPASMGEAIPADFDTETAANHWIWCRQYTVFWIDPGDTPPSLDTSNSSELAIASRIDRYAEDENGTDITNEEEYWKFWSDHVSFPYSHTRSVYQIWSTAGASPRNAACYTRFFPPASNGRSYLRMSGPMIGVVPYMLGNVGYVKIEVLMPEALTNTQGSQTRPETLASLDNSNLGGTLNASVFDPPYADDDDIIWRDPYIDNHRLGLNVGEGTGRSAAAAYQPTDPEEALLIFAPTDLWPLKLRITARLYDKNGSVSSTDQTILTRAEDPTNGVVDTLADTEHGGVTTTFVVHLPR